jgi:radical SAM superfamily enzyme YgiQ (UPF0313 family)
MHVTFIGSSTLGPLFIMGLLKKNGFSCNGIYQGIDRTLGEKPASGFHGCIAMDDLVEQRPDVVGFSASSFDIEDQYLMAAEVRTRLPEAFILFGGVHPTLCPEEVIAKPFVDAVCVGEGEYPMLELCQGLAGDKAISGIQNLWVKEGGTVHKNPTRAWVQDLDALPMDRTGLRYLGMFTGRGCTGNCSFCCTPTLKKQGHGRYYRKRSVENVLGEIGAIVEMELRIQSAPADGSLENVAPVRMKDDTFLADKGWFLRFAEQFMGAFPGLGYICQARADELDDEVVRALKDSGCTMVSLGIECGNENFRNTILKKRVGNDQIRKAVSLLKKAEIPVLGQWILGSPGESVALAVESLQFHKELGDIPQVHIATPFPHTYFATIAAEMDIFQKHRSSKSLYDQFVFPKPEDVPLFNIIYRLFPISRMTVPDDFVDISFNERSDNYKNGTMLADILLKGVFDAE